jgi:hypothetical protein
MLGGQMPQKVPKHIVRLLLLLGSFLLVAYAAKVYLTGPSYYRYGLSDDGNAFRYDPDAMQWILNLGLKAYSQW